MTEKIEATVLANIQRLSIALDEEKKMIKSTDGAFPSVEGLKDAIRYANNIFFPDLFDKRRNGCEIRSFYIGVAVEKLYSILSKEIARALMFETEIVEDEAFRRGKELSAAFIDTMPEIKRLLYTDVKAMYQNDPAVDSCAEVILCYPVVRAMVHYRVAHSLFKLNIPVLPRILTELAHSATGIDIHPGAEIGEYFAIDHGTGVVIGETCIIGNHVTLYQGVTLGAKNFTLDSEGHPINVPRHPILEDYVTVYSNASVLGRITVGRGSVIGGNVWLTTSVPPESRIMQRKPMATTFIDGLGI